MSFVLNFFIFLFQCFCCSLLGDLVIYLFFFSAIFFTCYDLSFVQFLSLEMCIREWPRPGSSVYQSLESTAILIAMNHILMTSICLKQFFSSQMLLVKSLYYLKSKTLSLENLDSKDLTMAIAPVLWILNNSFITYMIPYNKFLLLNKRVSISY